MVVMLRSTKSDVANRQQLVSVAHHARHHQSRLRAAVRMAWDARSRSRAHQAHFFATVVPNDMIRDSAQPRPPRNRVEIDSNGVDDRFRQRSGAQVASGRRPVFFRVRAVEQRHRIDAKTFLIALGRQERASDRLIAIDSRTVLRRKLKLRLAKQRQPSRRRSGGVRHHQLFSRRHRVVHPAFPLFRRRSRGRTPRLRRRRPCGSPPHLARRTMMRSYALSTATKRPRSGSAAAGGAPLGEKRRTCTSVPACPTRSGRRH